MSVLNEVAPPAGGVGDPAVQQRSLIRDQVAVLGVAEGMLQSAVLMGLLRLGVFDAIGCDAVTPDDLAAMLGVQQSRLRRALDAGVALGLLAAAVDLDGLRYRVPEPYRSVLIRSAGEGYLGDWLLNLAFLGDAVSHLDEAVLRAGPTVLPEDVLGADPVETRTFVDAMDNYASCRGRELIHHLDTSDCVTLLDVGCGPGTYAFELGRANPALRLHLLDLPGVVELARARESDYDLVNEVHYLGLDAVTDGIPGTYDLILVSNMLHMLGESDSRALLSRLYRAVNPGGSVVIQAQFLDDDLRGGRWPALLDIVQLCITEQGRNHSVIETEAWLREAGFGRIEHAPMGLLNTNSFLRGYRR